MPNHTHDLLIIGAGPAGYVAAIRAAQLGLNTAIVDKEKELGGTCLRVGCIPSKALLESSHKFEDASKHFKEHGIEFSQIELNLKAMLKRKDKVVKALTTGVAGLMKKNKITVYHGIASFNADKSVTIGEDTVKATHIIIATGSVPATIPGINLDDARVDTSTEALGYEQVPKHLAVIGAGVIGLELGSVWRRLGAKVTVIEYLDRIMPGMDEELAKAALKAFKSQGIEFMLGCAVQGVTSDKDGVTINIKDAGPVKADRVLVSVGRKPNTLGLGLEKIGITPNRRGQIEVDAHFKTSVDGIYAVGDVVPGPMLAHKAEEEGIACVERIATGHGHLDYNTIPSIVYTHPEIASVGKSEEQLREEGVDYKKGSFPFLANGRARANDDTEGWVKVLADAMTDRVLGVHIIGNSAGDLIAECATAMAFAASSEDIARACHAHPTLSEAVKEAALGVAGRSIHI